MKKLIIAEKPSVARDIAKVLKCNGKGDGYLYNDNYIISWAIGHLVTLFDPQDYDPNLKKWSYATLPIIPENIKLKPVKDTKKQYDILKGLINSPEVASLICATDAGREGELIFRYIYKLTKCQKPFERLWISSMTDAAIKAGFENLTDGAAYDDLYRSAKCRSEADWLVGINASRAFTLKYNTLLSIGRVQTPTLAIIVKRQKEIDSFKPEKYWEIEADFSLYKGMWISEKNETKINSKEKAEEIIKKVKGKEGEIVSKETERKSLPAPFLYDLTELQRDGNKKYGYSAAKTLDIVQSLYEKHKMVTYPRTDSRFLPDDMVPKIVPITKKIASLSEYKEYTDYILSLEKLPISKRIVDNTKISDHHAIIPTDINPNTGRLSVEEKNIYDLIVRRFMQVFYPNYRYDVTKIITRAEGENFLTKGNIIVDKGWTALNVNTGKEKKTTEPIPEVNKGDKYKIASVKKQEKATKPPANYDEASLLSAMENAGRFVEDEDLREQMKDSGLGTPATRSGIIERLVNVKYLERKGKKLLPTEKGIKLIDVVMPELKSPETTGKWEKGLSSISKGKMESERFMNSIKRYVDFIVRESANMQTNIVFPPEKSKGRVKHSLGKCPNCSGDILENTKAFFCTNWKNNCKFTIWKNNRDIADVTVSADNVKTLLKNGYFECNGKKIILKDKAVGGVKYE